MTTPEPTAATSPSAEASGQKVSWFELFYDLMVVAAISLVGKVYLKSPLWSTTGQILVAMIVLFTVWALTTVLYGLYRGDTFGRRALLLAQMIGIALAALALGDAGLADGAGLLALGAVLVVPAILFIVAARSGGPLAGPSLRLGVCCAIAAALLLIGAAVTPPEVQAANEWVVQGTAIAAILIVLIALLGYVLPRVTDALDWHHLDERFGLIVIIVLGESFLTLLAGLSSLGSIPRPGFFVLTIVVAYCLWALYFSSVQVHGAPRTVGRLRLWMIGHAVLVFCAVAVAVEFSSLTVGAALGVAMEDGNWTALPLAGAIGSITLLTFVIQGAPRAIRVLHLVTLAILLVLAVVDTVDGASSSDLLVAVGALVVVADTVACALVNRRPSGS